MKWLFCLTSFLQFTEYFCSQSDCDCLVCCWLSMKFGKFQHRLVVLFSKDIICLHCTMYTLKKTLLPWLWSLVLSLVCEVFKASISGLKASLLSRNWSYDILPCESAPNWSISSSRESSRLNSLHIASKSWLKYFAHYYD